MTRREALLAGLGAALTPFVPSKPPVDLAGSCYPVWILPKPGAIYPLDAAAAKRIAKAVKMLRCTQTVTVFSSNGDVAKHTIAYELPKWYCHANCT